MLKGLFSAIILCWYLPASAIILSDSNGSKINGTVGKFVKDGFMFHKDDNFYYQGYADTADVKVDANAQGDVKIKQTQTVNRISKMLDKDFFIKRRLSNDIRGWLNEKNYLALDNKIKDINEKHQRLPSGGWLSYLFYEAFTSGLNNRDISALKSRLKQIEAWQIAKPNSVAAKISSMELLNTLAWAYRGNGYNSTVTKKGRMKFKSTLKEVIEIGMTLKEKRTKDLMFYYYLIIAANGYGADKEALKDLSKDASNINALFDLPYLAALNAILPKWGGQQGEVEEFNQWIYQQVNEIAPEMAYLIHRDLKTGIKDKQYMTMNFDWPKIKKSFGFYVKKYTENDSDYHLMAKLASLHNDKVGAKKYFSQTVGGWNYLSKRNWTSVDTFERYKQWANTEAHPEYQRVIESILKDTFIVFSGVLDSLKFAKNALTEKDLFGNTLLHNLAEINAPKYLDRLSSIGFRLNEFNDDGYTPLQLAVKSNQLQNVTILLKNGADASALMESNNTALHLAANYGYTEMVKELVKHEPKITSIKSQNGSTALALATRNGHLATVTWFLSKSTAELNEQNIYHDTPLHHAVDRGHLEITKYLVSMGANSSLKNKAGYTALSLARKKEFVDIVEYLKGVGAEDSVVVNTEDKRNEAIDIYNQGNQYFAQQTYKQAKAGYLEAIAVDSSYHLAYFSLGLVAMNFEKDLKQADIYFSQAIKANPNYAESYYWKGRVNYSLNRREAYRHLFNKYIKMAPDTYNSQDLINNWSHALAQSPIDNEHLSLMMKIKILASQYSQYLIAFFSVLLLTLLLIQKQRKQD